MPSYLIEVEVPPARHVLFAFFIGSCIGAGFTAGFLATRKAMGR